MNPARRALERVIMRVTRTTRTAARRRGRARKAAVPKRPTKALVKSVPVVPQQVLFRLCKSGWVVIVEKSPTAQGTRFVCPFCPNSHRVPGPVRGFRKVRRAQSIKLRRVGE